MRRWFAFLSVILFFQFSVAKVLLKDDEIDENSKKSNSFAVAPQVVVAFPIFTGLGPQFVFGENFETTLLYGITPASFYSVIGSFAASSAGNSSYKDIVEAAFQNNSQLRLQLQYDFENHLNGWQMGFAYSKVTASGKASIDKVLYAATGTNFTNLKNLLAAAGRSSDVDMDSKLDLAEISLGYLWTFGGNSRLQASFGVSKVIASDVTLKTGLSAFEATTVGKNLIANTESEMESIISQYGVLPVATASWSYFF